MMKKLISLLLAVSLLFAFAVPVRAEAPSMNTDAYAEGVNERFGTFNREGHLRDLLDNGAYSAYLCYQKVENEGLLTSLTHTSMWVLDEDLDVHHWIGHLATLMTMQEKGFNSSADYMANYDTLKSFKEYAIDVVDVASGLITHADLKGAYAEYLKTQWGVYSPLLEMTGNTLEEYEFVIRSARNYANHTALLESIRNYAEDDVLREAAEYMLHATDIAFDLQMDHLRDGGVDALKLAQQSVFTPEMMELLKSTPEYATNIYDKALVDWFENSLKSLGDLAAIGKGVYSASIFSGDMIFGTTDTFKRYSELKANSILVETLQRAYGAASDWGETAEQNIKWIPDAIPLLQAIALLRIRGEYVNLSLATEDAQAMSLWQELCGKADVYREYYNRQEERLCTIWNELGKILQYTPFDNYELDFRGGDYVEKDLDGDGEDDILSCYQDGYDVVVAIVSSLGGQIEYRAPSMVARGTLVGVNLGDGTVTLVICVATGMAGGAGSVYCPVYRLIDEEYVQILENLESPGFSGSVDSSASAATVTTGLGGNFTGDLTDPSSDLAGKNVSADPIYYVSFVENKETGKTELLARQYLWSHYHFAGIGYGETRYVLNRGELVPTDQIVVFYSEME